MIAVEGQVKNCNDYKNSDRGFNVSKDDVKILMCIKIGQELQC